jgi:hypothetical protein
LDRVGLGTHVWPVERVTVTTHWYIENGMSAGPAYITEVVDVASSPESQNTVPESTRDTLTRTPVCTTPKAPVGIGGGTKLNIGGSLITATLSSSPLTRRLEGVPTGAKLEGPAPALTAAMRDKNVGVGIGLDTIIVLDKF